MKNITAVGEILFDIYPEYKNIGGAPFNFIFHIKQLTGKGNFISRIGKDENGKDILNFLKKYNFDTGEIQIDEEHTTGTVNVKLNESKSPAFNITTNCAYDFIETTESNKKLINNDTELLYFGTLAQREDVTRNTIQAFWGKEIKYFCDLNLRQNFYSDKLIEDCLINCSVLKINSDELKIISNNILGSGNDIRVNARTLLSKYTIELLCVTLGDDGAILFTKDNSNEYKENIDDIKDTVGAGDAYASILAIGYLNNWGLDKINTLASKFAADVCKIEGAVPQKNEFYNKYRDTIKNG